MALLLIMTVRMKGIAAWLPAFAGMTTEKWE